MTYALFNVSDQPKSGPHRLPAVLTRQAPCQTSLPPGREAGASPIYYTCLPTLTASMRRVTMRRLRLLLARRVGSAATPRAAPAGEEAPLSAAQSAPQSVPAMRAAR